MINWRNTKKKAILFRKDRKLLHTVWIFASPQVKFIVGCRRTSLCQARFYGLWRISCTCSDNCQKMQIPCAKAEERAIRDTIFLGMNSTSARDKAINLMNEEGKELTVEFLIQQLENEDCNAQHKSLSQLDSTTSENFAAYDCRQNMGKSNKSKWASGKNQGQNNSGVQGSSNSSCQSRKPPGVEGKCIRFGKPDYQLGQKCPAKNAKCKDCNKMGHFHKVYQTKKRGKQRAYLVQTPPQDDDDTHIDKNGVRQPNPPRVNMFKLVNHIEDTKGTQGKHLKFPITKHPRDPTNTI